MRSFSSIWKYQSLLCLGLKYENMIDPRKMTLVGRHVCLSQSLNMVLKSFHSMTRRETSSNLSSFSCAFNSYRTQKCCRNVISLYHKLMILLWDIMEVAVSGYHHKAYYFQSMILLSNISHQWYYTSPSRALKERFQYSKKGSFYRSFRFFYSGCFVKYQVFMTIQRSKSRRQISLK